MRRSFVRPRPSNRDEGQIHGLFIAVPIALWAIALAGLVASSRLDGPAAPPADVAAPDTAAALISAA
jgi:hypothetical protein